MTGLIHHTFAPHVTLRYCASALLRFLQPWSWKDGQSRSALQTKLSELYKGETVLFSSGREALLALLRSLPLQTGAEVIVQGYTCVAVPNAIHAAGGVPIFADIDADTLNLDVSVVESLITHRTQVIICQHTFGIPSDTKALRKLCDAHNITLIEDCAHVLLDSTGPKKIGEHGDFIICSFGRDKAVSGVAGGAVIALNQIDMTRLQMEEVQAQHLSISVIGRLLLYPLHYWIARPFYSLGIGKLYLWLTGKLRLLIPVLSADEKQGNALQYVHKMPNACAALALHEIEQIKRINDHRRHLTHTYKEHLGTDVTIPSSVNETLPLQKLPILIKNADAVRLSLKKYNIYLDDSWTGAAVCPRSVDQEVCNYKAGSCPVAERVAAEVLSLPTHRTMTEKKAKALLKELFLNLKFKI